MLLERQAALIGQMIRFGLTGGLLTVLVAGGYWVLATAGGVEPMLALTLSYLAVTPLGYLIHSRWSFKDHGSRDRPAARAVRFFTVNTAGFLMNQMFVLVLVKQMGGPVWWSVVPILLVTPIVTFALQRQWVFG